MVTLKDEKLIQVLNISNTLLEATEHFSGLIKNKEFNQSIFIYSSIVEGFEAINNLLTLNEINECQKERKEIERLLLLIAQRLEQGDLLNITAILQFSLMPQLRKLKQAVEESVNSEIQNKKITIGVYLCNMNPRDAYPEARIDALVQEAEQQNIKLFFFSSEDIDFDTKQVTADFFENKEWKGITTSFPDVIHNIGIKSRIQQSREERRLRREIPFTSFGLGNKFHLPKKLIQSGRYAELLVLFKIANNKSIIYDFLDTNESVVFKPLMGRQGQNIYFVERKGNRYSILDHKNSQIFNQEKFDKWMQDVILKNKNSYMIQRYIHCRTKDGEPYDIRAHVQKDGEGKWQLTKIYPRIGDSRSILSNISRGGRTEDLTSLFAKEFGEDSKKYEEDLIKLSMDLTWHLDKLHGLALDELGIDLAIDQNGRFWLHEVNNGPQSTYHEPERAVNTIAYANYIAKNGIVFTNEFQKPINRNGQFNARTTELPWANLDGRLRIGMLIDQNEINNLTVACAYVAKFEEKHFFYFTPKDIDYNEMLIRGYFYENKEWVPKVVDYPEVIYDRLRLRGVKGHNFVYEELEGIPFTNEFYGNSISKLEVYDKLSLTNQLDDSIIPYQKVDRIRDVFRYIERYKNVILKPDIGSFARGVHFIEKLDNGEYFVAEGPNEKYLSEISLSNYLSELIKNNTYIVQKYIETRTKDGQPFDVRVHMMKDGNGEWLFVKNFPRIGIHHAAISITLNGGYIGNLAGFLTRNFPTDRGNNLISEIENLSSLTVKTFEKLYEVNLGEIALDIAIDQDCKPYLIELNVNKPGIVYYEFDVAQHAIPYAIYLAENQGRENLL